MKKESKRKFPERFTFILNPYKDTRLSACPISSVTHILYTGPLRKNGKTSAWLRLDIPGGFAWNITTGKYNSCLL
jgi:hypothetical protein